MKSDVIMIDNSGLGYEEAAKQTQKVAAYNGIGGMEAIELQALTEEMLSLAQSMTGKMEASFWIEMEGGRAELHMTTKANLDKEKRAELIASATSRKNEAAKSFLGMIRDRIETAMAAEPVHMDVPNDLLADLPHGIFEEPGWDGYERSILRKLSDDVKVWIYGDTVEIKVTKDFGKKA